MGGHFTAFRVGAQVYYAENIEKVPENLQEVKPTMMIAVPRLYEVLYGRIMNGVKAKGGVSELLFMNAVKLGRKKLSGNFTISFSVVTTWLTLIVLICSDKSLITACV